MRKLSNIILINRFLLLVAVVFHFIKFFYGLYSQIALGLFQLSISLILLSYLKQISYSNKRLLNIYYLAVTSYLLLAFFSKDLNEKIVLVVVPMLIAFYFTFILERLKKVSLSIS